MLHFTLWHWIVTALFIPLLAYMVAQSMLVRQRKLILPMLFVSVAAVAVAYWVAIIALENVTKKGELLEIEHKRVLINETVVFKGRVRNVGDYPIARCTLHVRMVNEVFKSGAVGADAFYHNKPGFDITLEKNPQKEKPQVQEKDFTVAKDLHPGSIRPFAVALPYPPHFRKTRYFYKLKCH